MLSLFDPDLRKYQRLRKIGTPLMTEIALMELPKALIRKAAEDFRMMGKDQRTIVMEHEGESVFIMDRIIHDLPCPVKRWIEVICDEHLAKYSPEQQEYLKAHRDPVFSLYEVTGVRNGKGVALRDAFNGKDLFLIDRGFGTTASAGLLLATRVITLEGLHFTAGVAWPFSGDAKSELVQNFRWLFEKKKDQMSWDLTMRQYAAPYFFRQFRKQGRPVMFLPAATSSGGDD